MSRSSKILSVKPIQDDTGLYYLECSKCGTFTEPLDPGLVDTELDIHFEAHRGPLVLPAFRMGQLPDSKDLTPRSRVASISASEKEDRKSLQQLKYPFYPDYLYR